MTEVVAALIWDKNKFMICQRPAHKARGLLWEFVGGKVEPGETKQQALIRECREELAVTLDVGDVFMDVTHKYPDLTVHLTLFHATIREGVPQKLEHNDICWITLGEIDQYEFCPADKVILERLKTESKSPLGFQNKDDTPETDDLGKWDRTVAIASGVMTAALDILWTKDISLENAHDWGSKQTEAFVLKVAHLRGHKGTDLASAVCALEKDFPIQADKLTNDFGGGKHHHLRDFSHHPTPVGLLFSILSQFTGIGYGTDVNGAFIQHSIQGWEKPDLLSGLYNGTIVWFFHMVSDMAGSSGSIAMNKEGTGLPGPLLSLLKELCSAPGIQTLAGKNKEGRYNLSLLCSQLFNGTLFMEKGDNGEIVRAPIRFDLRTELGIANEALKSKQYFPVLLNEAIVCSFYSLSRLAQELTRHPAQTSEELQSLDLRRILPRCSPALRHMRMVAAAAFTVVDMGSAGLQAYFTHKGDPSGFALCFLQKINYVGLIRVGVAGTAEAAGVVGTLYGSFAALAERQKDRLAAANPALEEKAAVLKKAAVTVGTIGKVGTPLGFVSAAIGVYDEMSKALAELNIAREERIRVEEECAVRVRFLREHEAEMEVVVEQYMTQRLKTFVGNSDLLEEAFAENDADTFLSASAQIQKQLGWNETISSQDQFDAVMLSEEPLKL